MKNIKITRYINHLPEANFSAAGICSDIWNISSCTLSASWKSFSRFFQSFGGSFEDWDFGEGPSLLQYSVNVV